jgi:hypothetical protein
MPYFHAYDHRTKDQALPLNEAREIAFAVDDRGTPVVAPN